MNLDEVFDLTGKVIVITGGTGVLLSPTVLKLAELKAQIILLSRTPDEAFMEKLSQYGISPMFLSVDVSQKEQILQACDRIIGQYQQIDILINGAGGNRPGAITSDDQRFFDLPDEAIQQVFNVNLMGTLFACQVFGETMARQEKGVILNISSMAAHKPLTRVVAYSAAKAAVDNFTQWLAVHMAQRYSPNIRVNAIAPGFLLTDQNRYLLLDESGKLTTRGREIVQTTPMGRFGEPGEMTGTILWLISDAARFVTGIVVPVDGGFSAYGGV